MRSYAMNVYVGWTGMEMKPTVPDSDHFKIFKKSSDIVSPSPSQLLVIEEVHPDSICFPYFGMYMDTGRRLRIFHYPASYHAKSGVNGFADGHVENHRWRDARTINPTGVKFHNHDQPSPLNTDVTWLQERTTAALN